MDAAVAAFQCTLMEGLEHGAIKVGNTMIDALTFFEGLHLLWNVRATEAIAQSQGVPPRSRWLAGAEKIPNASGSTSGMRRCAGWARCSQINPNSSLCC